MGHSYFSINYRYARLWVVSCVLMLGINLLSAQHNRIKIRSGQEIFSSGMNMAWGNFARDLTSYDESIFVQALDEISEAGGNTMRWWLHVNGLSSPLFENDTVSGLSTEVENLRKILDLAYERHMTICISLWSHDMLSDGGQDLDAIKYMLEDTVGTMAYVNNALIPLVEGVKGHPAILCWEIFNEPEGMLAYPDIPPEWNGWTTRKTTYAAIKRFTNLCAGAIHRADPQALVTTGAHRIAYISPRGNKFKPEYTDSRLIAAGGDTLGTLDFYQVHYYNNFPDDQSPFAQPADYWYADKPIVIGEFSAHGPEGDGVSPTPQEAYQYLYDNGYAGAWSWTWTGHDGNGDVTDAEQGMMPLLQNYPQDIFITYAPGYIWFFSADDYSLSVGDSVLIKWAATDSSDVTLNGEIVAVKDSIYVKPDTTTTYTLTASGSYLSASEELTIEVFPTGYIYYFNADPPAIALGDSSILSWSVVKGSLVTLNGDTVVVDTSIVVSPDTTSTYTLRTKGTVNDSLAITIVVSDELIVNRALNHPAYASSNESISYDPADAVDGNSSTRWSSAYSDPQWIYVDLLEFVDVQRVVLNWEAAYGDDYLIQVSDNARDWTTIYSASNAGGGVHDITDLSGVGRFVRMYGTSRGPNNWGYSLWEFEVYGIPVDGVVVDSYWDDFNDGVATGWNVGQDNDTTFHTRTYELNEANGVFSIDYHRTNDSWEWDQFNLIPVGNVNASALPQITVKIKSTVATQVTLKPVYEEGDDWIQKNIPGDDTWRPYTFNLSGLSATPISRIFVYFDAGSTTPASGIVQFDDFRIAIDISGLETEEQQPLLYSLKNAYPNPFNPSTTIEFTVKKTEKVNVTIYNTLGQKIKTLYNDVAGAGLTALQWNGVNDFGNTVSSGVYFYRLQTESGYIKTKKMILMK